MSDTGPRTREPTPTLRMPIGDTDPMERGAYTADRAAALSGVPKSTVHHWARKELVVPSISPERVRLWSYTDLMGLRAIYWLRHPKPAPNGEQIPPTPMRIVREALAELDRIDLNIWDEESRRYMVRVTRHGEIYFGPADQPVPVSVQPQLEALDLIEPFESEDGLRGPDLVEPRPRLRIIPGKLAGAPHLVRTRLETEALAAIARRGVTKQNLYRLYPRFDQKAIDEALELEQQLATNLQPIGLAA
jgi:uncharacterized protein (DUF433 family)